MKRILITLLIMGMSVLAYASDKQEVIYTKDFKSYMNKQKVEKEGMFFIGSDVNSTLLVGIKIKF